MAEKKKYIRGKDRRIPEEVSLESLLPQKDSKKISMAQEFQLDLIARTNFNFCDGRRVAELLRENRHLWQAVIMPLNLISLRDMEQDRWHADTLYIYAEEGYQFQLEELVNEQFHADEVQWIGGSTAEDIMGTTVGFDRKSQVILSVWWD
jgi:hypothetical protein